MEGNNGFAGNIASKVSGNVYSMNLIGASPPEAVNVVVLGVDGDEDLSDISPPLGLLAVKINTTYYATVPTWVD